MPKVLKMDRTRPSPEDSVYIGRPSIFGNPFVIGRDGNREEVIAKYRMHLDFNPDLKVLAYQMLRGKDLVCHCAPLACHGDILLKIANITHKQD